MFLGENYYYLEHTLIQSLFTYQTNKYCYIKPVSKLEHNRGN